MEGENRLGSWSCIAVLLPGNPLFPFNEKGMNGDITVRGIGYRE